MKRSKKPRMMMTPEENFMDMVHVHYRKFKGSSCAKLAPQKKLRACLKCGIEFLSIGYGNRTCGSCAAQNSNVAKRLWPGQSAKDIEMFPNPQHCKAHK